MGKMKKNKTGISSARFRYILLRSNLKKKFGEVTNVNNREIILITTNKGNLSSGLGIPIKIIILLAIDQ